MANSSSDAPPFSIDMSWEDAWPLYTVYPLSTLLFLGFYKAGPKFWPKLSPRYANKMGEMSRMSWGQNTTALLHTVVLCPLLLAAIITDPEMRVQRPLHPHHNILGYVALCWSLGYFTFTIPWSYYLYCVKGERHATNLPLCIHHAIVWIAALTYLIGRTAALYGAVAFAAMEFTNWFFIAHLLQQQVRSQMQTLWTVNYVVLVFVGVIGCRLVLCTYMFVLFSADLSQFASASAAEWALVIFQYALFLMVVLLSWWFIWVGIKDAGLDKLALKKLGLERWPRAVSTETSEKSTAALKSTSTSPQKTPGTAVRNSSNGI